MRKEKYTGSWSANNSSIYSSGYTGSNKRLLAKRMREMAQGNVFQGNTGRWNVYAADRIDPILFGCVKN
jgi:hypothetical protein